ncbi:tail fibers protein [Vibrio phage JSF25]|uniref:Tail fibers protein n=1 Tax=Vibrio phage JSF25 TaxID=2026085 RepID=A0A2D0XVS9_9CAUD|nr:tail fibers protein [Vibrio phage JSF25]
MSGTRAPKTIVVYDITGQTDYTIPFEYLARKFVVVTLIGQDRKVLTLNTDYRFTTKTTIGLLQRQLSVYQTQIQ